MLRGEEKAKDTDKSDIGGPSVEVVIVWKISQE